MFEHCEGFIYVCDHLMINASSDAVTPLRRKLRDLARVSHYRHQDYPM